MTDASVLQWWFLTYCAVSNIRLKQKDLKLSLKIEFETDSKIEIQIGRREGESGAK